MPARALQHEACNKPSKMKDSANKSRRWPVVLACAIAIGLVVLYRFVGDRTYWGAWITIAPPVVWCVLLLTYLT